MTFAPIDVKGHITQSTTDEATLLQPRLPFLASNFDRLQMSDLLSVAASGVYAGAEVNARLYNGDHWLDSEGWTGPRPDEAAVGSTKVMDSIREAFVSKNIVKEVLDRHVTGVIGREPSWSFTTSRPDVRSTGTAALSTQDDPAINELSQALTIWWDEMGLHDILAEVVLNGLANRKSPLRFYIPPGLVDNNGQLADRPATLTDALRYIHIHSPAPTQASVLIDPTTMQRGGIYVWREDSAGLGRGPVTGATPRLGATNEWHAELVTLSGRGNDIITTIRELVDDGGDIDQLGQTAQMARLFLGGRLTINELVLPVMVTEQVRKLQYMVNQSYTMAQQNAVLGGFLERTVMNGQMPGHEEDDPSRPGRKRWIPDPLYVGAGAANFIAGYPIKDAGGNITGYTTPSMVYGQPVSPKTFEETVRMAYKGILEEVQQVHYLLAAENYLSGDSRRQARADFDASLRKTAGRVNVVGRWILETAAYMAYYLMGRNRANLANVRAVFTTRVDPGPATSEAIRSAIELFESGNLSQPTTQAWAGVDDVDAERKLIEEDRARGVMPQGIAALRLQQSEAAARATNAQASATGQPPEPTNNNNNNSE
jgi:hypothetical protein